MREAVNRGREIPWRIVARVVSTTRISNWLMNRAAPTPYTHIRGADGTLYMGRWWLFNPYPNDSDKAGWDRWGRSWRRHLPSVRIHWILRPDSDRHLHDHPWNARTIILRGFYIEELSGHVFRMRGRGNTGRLLFGEFHRIDSISDGGVWTLFITWKKQGTWGFDVDGRKVPWREYLGVQESAERVAKAVQA